MADRESCTIGTNDPMREIPACGFDRKKRKKSDFRASPQILTLAITAGVLTEGLVRREALGR